ncbi:MAG: protoheme IX farnesyltransferase [Chloroflexi bacterium]|nr:protoheme IX farnesyltransferase [Chloroflexota bacterium]
MTNQNPNQLSQIGKTRYLLLWSCIVLFLAIVSGGVVRVTGSACPDWPTCYGSWLPPLDGPAAFDYIHRLAVALSAPLLLIAAAGGWTWARRARLINLPVWLALALVALQAVLGSTLRGDLVAWDSTLHFGLALLALGLVVLATITAFVLHHSPEQPARLAFRSGFARSALAFFGILFAVLVSGAAVSAMRGEIACFGRLLCAGALPPTDPTGWIYIGHQLAVGITAVYALVFMGRAWRTQRTQRAILSAATIAVVLFFTQAELGVLKTVRAGSLDLLGLHTVTAAALWAAAVVLVAFVGLYARSEEEEAEEAAWPLEWKQRLKDLFALTKPIIVILLLVTTYGGMVIGAKAIPSLSLTFWTLLGGALAAGGSGAVNQYIDRSVDQRMTRTAKRPIAAGRITPAEGIAYGFGLLVIAFFLMAGFVNLLAALLSLAGMLYYVVLYSIYLKTTTVQNIVIGGGAGAIPPLVGWAAATGRLDVPALLLFAIIFMWTPPHFWALAIVRASDYARAGIPMLPVVRGEKETRRQVFIYTVELVALTLLMWFFKFAGVFYLVCALILGGYLIYTAWRVWRVGGNKLAWQMYRYSSMYLALLFLAMMVDALI